MGVPELFSSFIRYKAAQGAVTAPSEKGYWASPQRDPIVSETLETALILLPRSSPDTNTALLSSCCSAGTCHCTKSLIPFFSSHQCSILHLESLQPPSYGDRFSPEMENLPSSLEEAGTIYVIPDVNSILSLAATWTSCSLSSGLDSEPAVHVHSTHPTLTELCLNEDCSLIHRARLPWAAREAFTGEKPGWLML